MKTFLTVLLVSLSSLKAEVTPSQLFTDHMVIKRETSAPVWGTASPGEKVIVTTSWGESVETKADKNGKWKVLLKTPKAGGHTLYLSKAKTRSK